MNTGAYMDAVDAYSNIDNIAENKESLIWRCKCYIIEKELNHALSDLTQLVEITENAPEAVFDLNTL